LHKGGKPDIQESGDGHRYRKPESPATVVREKADKIRDPLEVETPVIKERNYSSHLHKPAQEAITPRNPASIETNSWRPFNEGKGGISNVVDELAGQAGVHNFEAPPEHDLDFRKNFRGRKP
jgi:hypothetical protein